MRKLYYLVILSLPLICQADDYQSSLLVQTGQMRESDLIVRTITDLESSRICLAFYIRTTGTSPVMNCYDAASGYASSINQVGNFKEEQLIVRKIKDTLNDVSCLVAYVGTAGTSPSIDCYKSRKSGKDDLVRDGHLREGDLDIYRVVDKDSTKTCLVAYVSTSGTAPSLKCYNSQSGGQGGLVQSSSLRKGDLIVRKIVDHANREECMISYVSTEGTSPSINCFDAVSSPRHSTSPTVSIHSGPIHIFISGVQFLYLRQITGSIRTPHPRHIGSVMLRKYIMHMLPCGYKILGSIFIWYDSCLPMSLGAPWIPPAIHFMHKTQKKWMTPISG